MSEWKKVKDLVKKIIGGGTPSRENDSYYNGDIPWATVKDMNSNVLVETQEYITNIAVKNSSTNIIPKGNVIIATRIGVGRAFLNKVDMAINQDLKALIPNDKVDPMFLLYSIIKSKSFLESISSGTTVKGIRLEQLNELELWVPDLKNQRKIAAILSTVDQAIEYTEAIIAQTETVKKSMMQVLFTKGISQTKFKKTEIGEIPKNWEVDSLQNITLPKEGLRRGPFGGALKKEIFVQTGYSIYEQQHAIYNDFNKFRYFISEEKFNEMENFKIKPKDLLISCSGTVGRVAIVPFNAPEGIINQALLRIRCDQKIITPEYLNYLLISDSYQSKLLDMSHGSTIKNIVGMPILREMKLPIPPIEEQSKIVTILDSIVDKLDFEQQYLSQLILIKKGLMKDLLTGKVRVNIVEQEGVFK
ncbi:restriction endonuclease subunit S [Gottfriedia solisilvae]|uniref:Type I restriction-modification protein subunit S n=1 Tax=Gottfriedia solisilvae TaxID=1516104 RepID=A0A8J3AGT4_9BACI|nr:restriction endonuclease subunit S [Gottfriedia solisilvae]GGI12579.1 type I restriction-modification protein subunit S [Gottfriedia solisilvae]